MKHTLTAASLLLCSLAVKTTVAQASNDDPTGKTMYVTEPFCTFYQCAVGWHLGDNVTVEWLNPQSTNVYISLTSLVNESFTYNMTSSTPAVTICANVTESCGMWNGTLPLMGLDLGNYSLSVTSLDNSSIVGYSDVINIAAALNMSASGSASTLASTSTMASASTISAFATELLAQATVTASSAVSISINKIMSATLLVVTLLCIHT